MVQVIPQEGGAAGIGSAFGKGLGEQIPKEMERYRFSEGLKNLENLEGLSPLQQAAKLYQATYDRPDIAQGLLPYVMQEARRKQNIGLYGGGQQGEISSQPGMKATPEASPNIQPLPSDAAAQPETPMEAESPRYKKLVSAEAEEALRRPISVPSEDQKRARAAQIAQSNPYLSWEESYQQAEKEASQAEKQQRTAKEEARDARIVRQDLVSGFKDYVETETQRALKDFDPFSGRIYKEMLAQAEDAVANGMSTSDAIQKYGKKFLPLAEASADLKSLGATWFGTTPKTTVDSIKQGREQYKKIGALNEFDKKLRADFNLTPYTSSLLAYPPSSSAKNAIKSIGKVPPPMFGKGAEKRDQYLTKTVKNVVANMKETDRPLSISMMAATKNIPFEEFIAKMYDLHAKGEIALSGPQAAQFRSLGEYPSYGTLNERLLLTFLGMDKIAENAFEER